MCALVKSEYMSIIRVNSICVKEQNIHLYGSLLVCVCVCVSIPDCVCLCEYAWNAPNQSSLHTHETRLSSTSIPLIFFLIAVRHQHRQIHQSSAINQQKSPMVPHIPTSTPFRLLFTIPQPLLPLPPRKFYSLGF